MYITSRDILAMVAPDAQSAKELIAQYEALNTDRRFKAEPVIWAAYDHLYDTLLQVNMEKGMDEAARGQESLDEGFYNRMRERTTKELEGHVYSTGTDAKLLAVREKLMLAMSGTTSN